MKKKRRILSTFLAACMVSTCFVGMSVPASAIPAEESTYTITIPSALTVTKSGWNSIGDISATGELASGKKLKVEATSGGEFSLVNTTDSTNKISYTLNNANGNAAGDAATSWEFGSLSSTPSTKAIGIVVDDYSDKPAGTYTDTVTFTAKVEDAVKVETLLTTLTFGGSSTYSETTRGVVSVTATNVMRYDSTYGWLWFEEGSLSVTAKEGYTITKCVFIQNAKTPITDTEAPFEIHSSDRGRITEDTNRRMDGVTSIEVYGYAN